jgi:hypothetical protein
MSVCSRIVCFFVFGHLHQQQKACSHGQNTVSKVFEDAHNKITHTTMQACCCFIHGCARSAHRWMDQNGLEQGFILHRFLGNNSHSDQRCSGFLQKTETSLRWEGTCRIHHLQIAGEAVNKKFTLAHLCMHPLACSELGAHPACLFLQRMLVGAHSLQRVGTEGLHSIFFAFICVRLFPIHCCSFGQIRTSSKRGKTNLDVKKLNAKMEVPGHGGWAHSIFFLCLHFICIRLFLKFHCCLCVWPVHSKQASSKEGK